MLETKYALYIKVLSSRLCSGHSSWRPRSAVDEAVIYQSVPRIPPLIRLRLNFVRMLVSVLIVV